MNKGKGELLDEEQVVQDQPGALRTAGRREWWLKARDLEPEGSDLNTGSAPCWLCLLGNYYLLCSSMPPSVKWVPL